MARRSERPFDTYEYALAALARRELSCAQLHQRLARRGISDEEIESLFARLRAAGQLDDRRAALAFARTAVLVKRRGRARVQREVEALGVDRATARDVVNEVFGSLDERDLIERALATRLRGRISDRRHFDRLYRFLLRQGFSSDRALSALRQKARGLDDESVD